MIHFNELGGLPDGEARRRAVEAAASALERDAGLAEAHRAVATVQPRDRLGAPVAESHFRKAIELDPGLALTRQRFGEFLIRNRRLEEGLAEMRRAHELDPASRAINRALAKTLYFSRQYDEIIRVSRVWLDADPADSSVRADLALAYVLKGMRAEAEAELVLLEKDEEGKIDVLMMRGYMSALFGDHAEAVRIVNALKREPRRLRVFTTYHIATIYAAMNRREEAFEHLRQTGELLPAATEAHRGFVLDGLLFDPQLDHLRGDARFDALLRRHGLA